MHVVPVGALGKITSSQISDKFVEEGHPRVLNTMVSFHHHLNTTLQLVDAEKKVFSVRSRLLDSAERCHAALKDINALAELHKIAQGGNESVVAGMNAELRHLLSVVENLSDRCSLWGLFKRTIGSRYMASMIAQRCTRVKEMQIDLERDQLMLRRMEIRGRIRFYEKTPDQVADKATKSFAKIVSSSRNRFESRSADLSGDVGSSLTVIATVGILSFSVAAAWFLSLGSRSAWLNDVQTSFRDGTGGDGKGLPRGDDLHFCRVSESVALLWALSCFYTCVVTSMTLRLYIGLTSNAGIVDFICGIIGFPKNGHNYTILTLPYKAFILGFAGLFLSLTLFTMCRFHAYVAMFGLVMLVQIMGTVLYVMYAAQKAAFPVHKRQEDQRGSFVGNESMRHMAHETMVD